MPTSSAQVNVTTTAARLTANGDYDRYGRAMLIRNRGAASVFLGGSDVTTGNGYELDAGGQLTVGIKDNSLWARSASGTCRVDLLINSTAG